MTFISGEQRPNFEGNKFKDNIGELHRERTNSLFEGGGGGGGGEGGTCKYISGNRETGTPPGRASISA